MKRYHVYRRVQLEAVLAGEVDPGPAMPLCEAVCRAAELSGRTPASVAQFALKSLRARGRVYVATRSRSAPAAGWIIARAN